MKIKYSETSIDVDIWPMIFTRIHTQKYQNCWKHRFLRFPCRMKDSRPLVLPRTSCMYNQLSVNQVGRKCYKTKCPQKWTIIRLSAYEKKVEHCVVSTDRVRFSLRGFSPQANYTDRATAACRRS
jgi:hypothetical protein